MGVIYKLKPEIRDFILTTRKINPHLGCRAIAALVEKKFKTIVSKSAINGLIKSTGLSMPVGRRHKTRQGEAFGRGLGAILLKAADYLLGGTQGLAEIVKKNNSLPLSDIIAGMEYLLYSPLFDLSASLQLDCGLWPLISSRIKQGEILKLAAELQKEDTLSQELSRHIAECVKPVRCIRAHLSDGNSLYLDGQLHTVWSGMKIPDKLSTTLSQARKLIAGYLRAGAPLIFFMAPGYEAPTREFFNFIQGASGLENRIVAFTPLGSNLQELETIKIPAESKEYFSFGLWPWQFAEHRKIKLTGDFKAYYFSPLKESSYIAPVTVELSLNQQVRSVSLKGCALKEGLDQEIRLMILTNFSLDNYSLDNFVSNYWANWPNFEATFQDLSRKIELQDQAKSLESALHFLTPPVSLALGDILSCYLEVLNVFVGFYFLPPAWRDTGLTAMQERFYRLNGCFRAQKERNSLTFLPPADYPLRKELQYLSCRLNERNIQFPDDKKLWFVVFA